MANTTRGYSFEDFSKTQPGQPLPGNRLDIELDRIYRALSALEDFSKVSFSPDGTLRGQTISEQHLKAGLLAPLIQQVQAKIDAVLPLLDARDKSTQNHLIQAKQALAEQHTLLDQTRSLNDQTEQAMAKAVLAAADAVQSRSRAENSLQEISARAADAATSAAAARIAEDMAYRWAEKLDGPVFLPNGADPVDDGFYSSKFWALWTKTAVDFGSWWYLGVHPAPPTTDNSGGPLQPGMWYFDSSDGQTYIWNGTDWDAITGDTGEVLSVFGRKGSVIAQAPDYEAFYADKTTTEAALADRYTKAQVDASQAAQDTAIGTKLTQAQVDARVRVIGDPVWVQYKDNWVAGTYEKWAIVGHNGGTWIATTTTTQEPGPASSQWDTLGGAGGAFVGATPPPSPAQGQLWYCTVNPVGLYVWYTDADSSQWVSTGGAGGGISQDAADNRYLKLTGGTLTGVLSIAPATGDANLTMGTVAGQRSTIAAYLGAYPRWNMVLGDSTVGGNFYLQTFSDTGVGLGNPISVERATGYLSLNANGATLRTLGGGAGGDLNFYLNKAGSGKVAQIIAQNNGSIRWVMAMASADAETGSNVGSDFIIGRFSDTGASLGNIMSFARSTGFVTFQTPQITLVNAAGNANIGIQSDVASEQRITFAKANQNRWAVISGVGAASDFYIQRCNDAGTAVDNPIIISRATGAVSIPTTLGVTGVLSSAARVTGSQIWSNSNLWFGNDAGCYLGVSGSIRLLQWQGNWYDSWVVGTGVRQWVADGGGTAVEAMTLTGGGLLTVTSNGQKPGGGAWAATSDARIKTVDSGYAAGLDAILRLNPVVYHYNGNDTPTLDRVLPSTDEAVPAKDVASAPFPASAHYMAARDATQFVGFVAQEVETVMPEMVKRTTGFIDGIEVDDLRTIDTGPLIYALVNAVKELAAQLAELKTQVAQWR